MRRLSIGLLGGVLVLAACGDPDSDTTADTNAPVDTEAPLATPAPADTPAEAPADEAGDAPVDTEAPAPAATEAPPASDAESGDAESEPAEQEPAEDEPAPTTTLAPEPAPAPLGGRALGEALRPESATDANPFPDLLVDDISRRSKVNLRNVVPADRPVLVWAWAPH